MADPRRFAIKAGIASPKRGSKPSLAGVIQRDTQRFKYTLNPSILLKAKDRNEHYFAKQRKNLEKYREKSFRSFNLIKQRNKQVSEDALSFVRENTTGNAKISTSEDNTIQQKVSVSSRAAITNRRFSQTANSSAIHGFRYRSNGDERCKIESNAPEINNNERKNSRNDLIISLRTNLVSAAADMQRQKVISTQVLVDEQSYNRPELNIASNNAYAFSDTDISTKNESSTEIFTKPKNGPLREKTDPRKKKVQFNKPKKDPKNESFYYYKPTNVAKGLDEKTYEETMNSIHQIDRALNVAKIGWYKAVTPASNPNSLEAVRSRRSSFNSSSRNSISSRRSSQGLTRQSVLDLDEDDVAVREGSFIRGVSASVMRARKPALDMLKSIEAQRKSQTEEEVNEFLNDVTKEKERRNKLKEGDGAEIWSTIITPEQYADNSFKMTRIPNENKWAPQIAAGRFSGIF